MGAAAPLTLRDFLEMACESSCSDGFRSYPRRLLPCPVSHSDDATQEKLKAETAPVRLLIEADLRRSPSRTLSSILFPRSPRSLAAISRLSRTLSRRLVFWRRHPGDDDGSERDSLGLPSPVVSSCSASEHAESDAEAPGPPPVDAAEEKPASKPSPSSSSGSVDADDGHAAAGAKHKEQQADGGDAVGSTEEEKQQLSPVSVMDFPFHDDDETSDAGTCSPATSFQHCLPDDPERSNKAQAQELLLLHKIRRLDGLAQAVGPVDLEAQFGTESDRQSAESDDTHTQTSNCSSTSADHGVAATWSPRCRSADRDAEREPDVPRRLLARLLKDDDDDGTAVTSGATERLLLDFFAEGLDRRRASEAGPVVSPVRPSDDESALVRAAQDWVQGAGTRWGAEDVLFAGEAALADMDRGRRWVRAGEEEREVGAALEGLVMDELVAELVSDLALARR
ncbi:hypothetical protein CFC21_063517 [Triticum aestivum]|uniref:DUF4378 domain-containing protein n=2 Tax=Triticum aestivum TaxID=4565 RepID=A0A9R1H076_WHEAT|nr:uncharacterized protein LOC123099047 isoform X2 [Triticum aestivum]KAF7056070.1 hypothetical protein CFC21_063517 [Triticum aestivum]